MQQHRRLLVASLLALPLAACDCDEVISVKPGSIHGVVCNPLDGSPVAGATVAARDESGAEYGTSETDDDGVASLLALPVQQSDLEGTPYTVVVRAATFTRELPAVGVSSGQRKELNDSACRPPPSAPGTGAVAGTFCATHVGGVIANAPVIITLADGTTIETTTDADGSFVEEVPAGSVTVVVDGPIGKTYGVVVAEGQTTIVEQSVCTPPPFLSTNHITGTVCLNDGDDVSTALVRASWRDNGGSFSVDGALAADGSFDIDGIAPCPVTDVFVEVEVAGRRRSFNVPFVPGRVDTDGVSVDDLPVVDDVAGDDCVDLLPDDERRYLVVTGAFDSIETALARAHIANVELWNGQDLLWANQLFASRDRLARYDAIFVNCGVNESELASPGGLSINARQNLLDYVDGGGALYVSDHSYDLIEQVFPDAIRFFGDESVPSSAELSLGDRTYEATVVDPELQASLGVASFPIAFTFQGGTVIQSVADTTDVFLTADLSLSTSDPTPLIREDTPLTVRFPHGAGDVIFSAFHQEKNGSDVETLDGPEDQMLQELVLRLR